METKWIILSFITGVFFLSCNKEKQHEKQLYRGHGEWNMSTTDWKQIHEFESVQADTSGQTIDAGLFTFSNNRGWGSYDFKINGEWYSQNFHWNFESDSVFISQTFKKWDYYDGLIKTTTIDFKGKFIGEKHIQLVGSEIQKFESGHTYRLILEIELYKD